MVPDVDDIAQLITPTAIQNLHQHFHNVPEHAETFAKLLQMIAVQLQSDGLQLTAAQLQLHQFADFFPASGLPPLAEPERPAPMSRHSAPHDEPPAPSCRAIGYHAAYHQIFDLCEDDETQRCLPACSIEAEYDALDTTAEVDFTEFRHDLANLETDTDADTENTEVPACELLRGRTSPYTDALTREHLGGGTPYTRPVATHDETLKLDTLEDSAECDKIDLFVARKSPPPLAALDATTCRCCTNADALFVARECCVTRLTSLLPATSRTNADAAGKEENNFYACYCGAPPPLAALDETLKLSPHEDAAETDKMPPCWHNHLAQAHHNGSVQPPGHQDDLGKSSAYRAQLDHDKIDRPSRGRRQRRAQRRRALVGPK